MSLLNYISTNLVEKRDEILFFKFSISRIRNFEKIKNNVAPLQTDSLFIHKRKSQEDLLLSINFRNYRKHLLCNT